MSSKLNGVVYSVGATQNVSEKFSKREIIIVDESGKYPQHIAIQFTQDKCNDLNGIAPGQEVEISYNLTGKLWLDPKTQVEKCFNTLNGWKIEAVGNAPVAPQVIAQSTTEEDGDLLPF
jgi:hypothetical protein